MEVTEYDWRSLQPVSVKDPNDNISEMLYDALGLPVAMALKGKGSEGDTLTGIDPEDGGDIDDQEAFWTDPQGLPILLVRCFTRPPGVAYMICRCNPLRWV